MLAKLWTDLIYSERLILSIMLLSLTLILIHENWLWRWDQTIYDAHSEFWLHPPAKDLIIVAIDGSSLANQGSWPWPREKHARLIHILTDAGAKVIVFDIIFAEPSQDHPDGDKALQTAIQASGKVILPVLVEQMHHRGQLVETLPIPDLTHSAANLGHIHIELDADGMARSVYLQEGLGTPRWPTLSLAALQFLEPGHWQELPGKRKSTHRVYSAYNWIRDYKVWIPFSGPPGLIPRISYDLVLRKEFPADTFQDKIIFVGSTVSGLSDSLPTPVSGFNQSMSGVEMHANILMALRDKNTIIPMAKYWQIGLSILIVIFPAVLFPLFSPRSALLIAALLILSTFGFSSLMLIYGKLWFPPMAVVLSLSLSYPIWSWRRLESTIRFLNKELEVLSIEPEPLAIPQSPKITSVMALIQSLFPIKAWVIQNASGQNIQSNGGLSRLEELAIEKNTWHTEQNTHWILIEDKLQLLTIGLQWAAGFKPTKKQLNTLKELLIQPQKLPLTTARSTVEIIETRIQQVQEAASRLRSMRHLISNSLEEMADGILITNLYGQVLVANHQAAYYLQGNSIISQLETTLSDVLKNLQFENGKQWQEYLATTITESVTTSFYAQTNLGRDLYIQMTRLSLGEEYGSGIIVNLTDISNLKDSERRRLELLNFLSHDLRSPLVSILALLELAKQNKQGIAIETDLLKRIESYTGDLLEFSDNFIHLSRAEGLEEAVYHEIDLINIACNAIDHVWPQASKKKILINQEFKIYEAWFLGDAQLLERAFINLLTNAIKYSPHHSSIDFYISNNETAYICKIEDNGVGISESYLPFIFDRFSREKKSIDNKIHGSGLGLAFVSAVIKKHQADIDVTSIPGKGSSFTIRFPIPKETENS